MSTPPLCPGQPDSASADGPGPISSVFGSYFEVELLVHSRFSFVRIFCPFFMDYTTSLCATMTLRLILAQELPRMRKLVGGSRWVTVNAESGFHFNVFISTPKVRPTLIYRGYMYISRGNT
jgi:hypothetical protein